MIPLPMVLIIILYQGRSLDPCLLPIFSAWPETPVNRIPMADSGLLTALPRFEMESTSLPTPAPLAEGNGSVKRLCTRL